MFEGILQFLQLQLCKFFANSLGIMGKWCFAVGIKGKSRFAVGIMGKSRFCCRNCPGTYLSELWEPIFFVGIVGKSRFSSFLTLLSEFWEPPHQLALTMHRYLTQIPPKFQVE
jgi:polyferredoxin